MWLFIQRSQLVGCSGSVLVWLVGSTSPSKQRRHRCEEEKDMKGKLKKEILFQRLLLPEIAHLRPGVCMCTRVSVHIWV